MAAPTIAIDYEAQNSLEAYSVGLCSKTKPRVLWGKHPKTDGSSIWYPEYPAGADESLKNAYRLFALHECGHIEHTDFRFLARLRNREMISPMLHSIWNSIEDPWMEGEQIKTWPGGDFIFRTGKEGMIKRGMRKDGSNKADLIPMLVLFRAELISRDWDFIESQFDAMCDKAIKVHGNDLVETVISYVDSVFPTVASTQDAMRLARAIFELLPNESQQQNPSNGEGYQVGKYLEEQVNEETKKIQEQKDSKPDPSGKGSESKEGSEDDAKSDPDGPKPDSDKSQKGAGQPDGLSGVRVLNPSPLSQPLMTGLRLVNDLKPFLINEIRVARKAKSGRIQPNRIHRVITDDPYVFRKNRTERHCKASVGLLLDLSGSMVGSAIDTAISATQELAGALRMLQVPTGVWGFGDSEGHSLLVGKQMRSNSTADIAGLQAYCGGGTPLTEALDVIRPQFEVPTDRRVLMIVTDGDPSDPVTAREAVNDLLTEGYLVVFINIGMKGFMNDDRLINININNGTSIVETLSLGLRSALN